MNSNKTSNSSATAAVRGTWLGFAASTILAFSATVGAKEQISESAQAAVSVSSQPNGSESQPNKGGSDFWADYWAKSFADSH